MLTAVRAKVKEFLKNVREVRANATSGFRLQTWRSWVGFGFTWYERRIGVHTPVTFGYQVRLGFSILSFGV